MKRFEKIEKLKNKWRKEKNEKETDQEKKITTTLEETKEIEKIDAWSVWRKRKIEKTEFIDQNESKITMAIEEEKITPIKYKKLTINLPRITIKNVKHHEGQAQPSYQAYSLLHNNPVRAPPGLPLLGPSPHRGYRCGVGLDGGRAGAGGPPQAPPKVQKLADRTTAASDRTPQTEKNILQLKPPKKTDQPKIKCKKWSQKQQPKIQKKTK